jgi:hypothetical protein
MTGQVPLVTVAATPRLKPRQEAAWTYVKSRAGGCTAVELGSYLHALRGRHPDGETCLFCVSEGNSVLRSKALRPLVIRRRTGRWEPRTPTKQPAAELPGETFEDLFR